MDAEVERQKIQGDASTEYNLAQILVSVPEDANATQIATLRHQAETVRDQALHGDDFFSLAAHYSSGAEAMQGGRMGWRTAQRLPNILLEAVRSLHPGDISPIIRSPGGFHIIKLLEKKGIGTFEEKKADIKAKLSKDSRSDKSKGSFISKLKKECDLNAEYSKNVAVLDLAVKHYKQSAKEKVRKLTYITKR